MNSLQTSISNGCFGFAFLFLQMAGLQAAPSNDLCSNAIPLQCDQTLVGTTTGATDDVIGFSCGTADDAAPCVWYLFAGNGSFVKMSLCSGVTSYDSKLFVLTGICGPFTKTRSYSNLSSNQPNQNFIGGRCEQ